VTISSPNRNPVSISEIEHHHEAATNEVISSMGAEWRYAGQGSAGVKASHGMNELGMNKLTVWCRA
jgi:hypothetical protein